jgi:putative transposase
MWRETIRRLAIAGPGDSGPVARPEPWLTRVNGAAAEAEMQRILQGINWGAPYGLEGWITRTAACLGLNASHRPIGRPEKLVEM